MIKLPRFVTRTLFEFCPFKDKLCIHPDWSDCQFQYSMDDPRYVELWRNREEYKMATDCPWLPKGISRTDMLAALGAYGEEEKQRVLQKYKEARTE